jgi:hypothetical protein
MYKRRAPPMVAESRVVPRVGGGRISRVVVSSYS